METTAIEDEGGVPCYRKVEARENAPLGTVSVVVAREDNAGTTFETVEVPKPFKGHRVMRDGCMTRYWDEATYLKFSGKNYV